MRHRRKLYVKSKWPPPIASKNVKERISNFEKSIVEYQNFLAKVSRPATNLFKIQLHLLEKLRQDTNFIVLPSDKNLGPTIMDRSHYIKLVLQQHLLDPNTYEQLTTAEALHTISEFKSDLLDILELYKLSLSD